MLLRVWSQGKELEPILGKVGSSSMKSIDKIDPFERRRARVRRYVGVLDNETGPLLRAELHSRRAEEADPVGLSSGGGART